MTRRPDRLLLDAFGWTTSIVDWSFLLLGLAGAVGTAAGWLPPFGGPGVWARVANVLVWVVVARQGYDGLVDDAEDAIDGESAVTSRDPDLAEEIEVADAINVLVRRGIARIGRESDQ